MTAGAAAAAGVLAGCNQRGQATAAAAVAPPLPWKYTKLDPEEAGRRGYQNYLLNGGWGSGAWLGVLSLLKETVGHPYTMLSDDMFHHAAAGYGGQGTLCGSLGASAALINLVAKDQDNTHNKIIADMINWYASATFPTNRFDDICKYPGQVQVSPNSPLCHVSVSTWTMAAGTKIGESDRKDRCAKVAGEVAMQTVLRLNAYADGKFAATAPAVAEATSHCLSCHGPEADHNQQGQMACGLCHTDHTK